MEKTKELIVVPKNAYIRVDWRDYPENNTVESKNRVKSYFAKKYGVEKSAIKINFIPIIKNSKGQEIDITDGLIENIMDSDYQRRLFKEWLDRNEVNVEFDRICKLDDQVNVELFEEQTEDYRYRRWVLKKLWIDNFLSYGDGNVIEYDEIKGFIVVNSDPANQGGKTIFSVESLLFLFFGKTTKADVAEEVFNSYRDKNEVTVGGLINIDGLDYIIERTVKRKAKKAGGYTTSSKLEFYKLLSDGNKENLEGEQRRETDKLITETIGSYDDFMTTIVATAANLEDLIGTKPTQRGRLLTKFIGLEPIEKKELIVKKKMSDFKSVMKSNIYNLQDLNDDITLHKQSIVDNNDNIIKLENLLGEKDSEIKVANEKKEKTLSQKIEIDSDIKNINPTTLKSEIDDMISGGVIKKEEFDKVTKEIELIGDVYFNEDQWNELTDESLELKLEVGSLNKDIEGYEKDIKGMKEGEFCALCKQPLKDVDHTDQIKELEEKINETKEILNKKTGNLLAIGEILSKLAEEKTKSDNKDKKSLIKDRLEVELDRLRVDVKEKKNILKEYEKNEGAIDTNRSLDSKILGYNQLITNLNLERDQLITSITESRSSIENSEKIITENTSLIDTIKKENEVLRIYDIYHKMIGKNGISKLVLTSVIPIINYELSRLLDDVCDFEIELEINSKNEVEFLIIKSGVTKKLKSGSGLELTIASLALRCILGRISTLPKPNIIVFDEVLGKVANVNLDNLKLFFDKIKMMFDTILFITHNPIAQEWADKMITISKKDDISSLDVKKIIEQKTLFDV